MKLYIRHRTSYRYAIPVAYSIQLLRLAPRSDGVQQVLTWQIHVPGRRCLQRDAFGNNVQLVTVEGTHADLTIEASGVVETDDSGSGRIVHEGPLSPLAYLASTHLTEADEAISALAASVFHTDAPVAESVSTLMERVTEGVRYQPGVTAVSDRARDVLARGEGVCQDQAHVAIAACRAAGIPARYVSGYLLDESAAQAASHAWIDVWDAAAGDWLSCDVTHRRLAGGRLCRLAVGRDYLDAAPVRGVRRGGGEEALSVSVQVSASQQQ